MTPGMTCVLKTREGLLTRNKSIFVVCGFLDNLEEAIIRNNVQELPSLFRLVAVSLDVVMSPVVP